MFLIYEKLKNLMSKVVIYSTLNFYLDTIHGFYFNKKKLRQQIILEWKL